MRILSINIRATQGGAGRVGYDLHHRLKAMGEDCYLLYGYASGIRADPKTAGELDIQWLGSRSTVLANFAAHFLAGSEIRTAGFKHIKSHIARADVIHLHAPHHYYLNWNTVTRLLAESGKPVVITAHDWWLVSGRCGFARDCTGWERACGECGYRRFEDLPSLRDRSRQVRVSRHASLRRLRNQLAIVCPSKHLCDDHRRVFPDLDVRFIPNALDREFETALSVFEGDIARNDIVFCASDLASPGKIDAGLVRSLASEFGGNIKLVGRGSPFSDTRATDLGEVRDRTELARIFASTRALMFTSQMDNAPLTIIEALSSGAYVIAYPSAAADEMLRLVGGRCAKSPDEAREIVRTGRECELYGGQTHLELARRAREIWLGETMAAAYRDVYRDLSRMRDEVRG